ncbi:uncharacterized protein C22orf46 homolog [Otolemur garnettii]|nr:uncharacterized protein C22orf46 homolog [Otolemur garnettii]
MFLSLLGACAVVGPFHGSEWEPVRGLFSQDHSCKDPRCYGNLLVLCLFLIWQVRHYWHHVTRTCPSRRNVTKMPLQKWAVSSMRQETFFRPTSGKFRGLDAPVQNWAQKERWGYRMNLQESWAQYLLSPQHQCQGPRCSARTHSEPTLCTTSFSNTCLLPQGSSWKAWQVPWCLSDGHTHPVLDMSHKVEQLVVHSQKNLMELEPVISMRSGPTSLTLTTSLPNLPSAQRLQFPRKFLPDPSNQLLGMHIWKSWNCPQEAWASWGENQTGSRKYSSELQTPEWMSQRNSRGENAWEIQASRGQLPIDFGMDAETKVLGYKNHRLVISKTDGEISTAGWEKQDQIGIENRAKIQDLGKRNPREAGGKNPPEIQAHMGENQEYLSCKIDAETQTPEWGNQDKNGGEDALESKNKKEVRGEGEGEIHAQGLGKKDQIRGKNGEETQMPEWGKQDQTGGDTGAGIQIEEGRDKDQVGDEDAVQILLFGKDNLGEVKKEDVMETQTLEWGKHEYIGNEKVTEIQAPGREKQDQDGSKETGKTKASRGENQKLLKHEIQLEWENQGLGREKNVEETQILSRKKLKEIREEDWVVIQAPWWGNQTLIASAIDGEFEIPCWGNQNQIGDEYRAENQSLEKKDQRKDGDEDHTNALPHEAKNQEQLSKSDVETHPAGMKNKEQFGDENDSDIQALGQRNLRGVKGDCAKETQELGEENRGQLGNEINGKIHIPKWKNQEHIKGKDGANTQASEAENWDELTSKTDGETHSAGWKKEEQIGGKNGAEIQIQGKRNLSEVGGKDGTEIWTPGKENQLQFRSDIDRKILLSECKNQEQIGGENGTETQVPEKRNQREPGGEDAVKTQSPKRENQGQLDSETGESHSLGTRNWEEMEENNIAEDQAFEKRNQREVESEDVSKIQRLREKNERLLKSKVNKNTCSLEWKNQEHIGDGNDEESQIQGKRNLRGTADGDGTEIHAPGRDDQGQLRSETDGQIQAQGQGNQKERGDEDAAELQDVGSQRKCRAEDTGEPQAPRGRSKDQVREKDIARANLQVDSSGSEGPTVRKHSLAGPPAFTGSGYGAMEQEQAVAANGLAPAPCPEMKPLASQGTAPARQHRVGVSSPSQQGIQAGLESWRRQQRIKRVDSVKASSPTQQPWSHVSSARPPLLYSQAPQAMVGAPTALTVLPKWPMLKRSKRLLLESLMRRRIAHLKWGLPQRILDSYLLFHFLGSCSLPLMRLPGLYLDQELQGHQERHCEAHGSMPGPHSPQRFQRVQPIGRKSSKLSIQVRALEKYRPEGSEPRSISTLPEKPRRVRPRGGARELQVIQEGVPRAKLAPRNPRPAAESRSWCEQESIQESSSENRRGRKMIRPCVSQMADRAPGRLRTLSSRTGHDLWRKESTSWEASELPGPKCHQPTYWGRGSLELAKGRESGQQPSSDSTETVSLKGSLYSAAAKLSMTLLKKMSWFPHLAKPQYSVPNLSLRDPTLFPKLGDPHVQEDNIGDCTSLEKDLQPAGEVACEPVYCVGATLPNTESPQGQVAPGNPHGVPKNLPASKKIGFMKHLRVSVFHCGFKK